jgi:predicted dehydrogenase
MNRPLALILATPDHGPDPSESVRAFLDELDEKDRIWVVGPIAKDVNHSCADSRVSVLPHPPEALVPDLWRAGLDASTEPLVAFSTAGMAPNPGWRRVLVSALTHSGASAVGGPIAPATHLPGTDRAVYLHRYARYWPPVNASAPPGPPGENALYVREHLHGLEPLSRPGFWEVEVLRALQSSGHSILFEPSAVVTYTGGSQFKRLLPTRFRHARRFGAWRSQGQGGLTRYRMLARTPLVPALLIGRAWNSIRRQREPWRPWSSALPQLTALASTWAVGEAAGTLFGEARHTPETEAKGHAMITQDAKQTLGILVVGVGWLGSRRARAALAARGTRLAAVLDEDPARARREAEVLGVLAAPDLATALALPGVDAVIIATPPGDHARILKKCLEADKHVLCEKPLTVDPYQARSLAQLATDRRLRLATGFDHRFWPPVAEALALVRSGRIGPVETVRAQIGHKASAQFLASWHIDPEFSGGGCLIDNGPHACDLIRQIAGEVVAAKGYVSSPLDLPEGCESEALALFRGHDNALASLHVSWTLPAGYLTLEILGRDGFLHVQTAPWRLSGRLGGGRRINRTFLVERAREAVFRRLHGCGSSLVAELEAFADAAHPHPRPGATGWDGCRATEMVQAVYRASETGEEVFLDPLPVRLPEHKRARAPRETA